MLTAEIIRRIAYCQTRVLTLSQLEIMSEQLAHLIEAINNQSHIQSLDLSFNDLDARAIESLLALKYVKELNLSHNHFTDQLDALVTSDQFSAINLSSNNIPCETVQRLMATTKVALELRGNPGWAKVYNQRLTQQPNTCRPGII